MKRVTIVGLGLIGGSIAKALRERESGVFILAVDRGDVGARSDVQQVISEFVELDAIAGHRQAIEESDLVVLCQPVRAIADTVASFLRPDRVVTDTGSTKRLIAEQAGRSPAAQWFVPGHPMAGRAEGGFANSSADLFEGRTWIVCPAGRAREANTRVDALIDLVGARRIAMTPEEHDAAVAITSHMPQLLSSWLRLAGSERRALATAGPAFTEMTRTAGGAEAIWRDIYDTNADEVGQRLKDAALALASVADALLSNPPRVEAVLELLRRARLSRGCGGDPGAGNPSQQV